MDYIGTTKQFAHIHNHYLIILGTELDRDPYPWVIWYLRKARNDKLFRVIYMDPLELIKYAEGEC